MDNKFYSLKYKDAPLYTEVVSMHDDEKGDILSVLVALNPHVWMRKNKWVWLETHPDELNDYDPKRDLFIFLDGDYSNYSPANIEKITRSDLARLNATGGIRKGVDPKDTLLRIANNRLKTAVLDAGERMGLVTKWGNIRAFKEEKNRISREWYKKMPLEKKRERNKKIMANRKELTPERKKALNEYNKKYRAEHPEQFRKYWKKYRDKKKLEKIANKD